ncbi:unnamed protein product [Jaminaea pallidilutea]
MIQHLSSPSPRNSINQTHRRDSTMIDALTNRPNTIPQRQRMYQSDTRPVYMRGPRSRMYMAIYMGFFTVGVVASFGGLVNAARGKKEEGAP